MAAGFESFLEAHPSYSAAYERLLAANRVLATSAQLVYELHPEALGSVAEDILSFVQHNYPSDYMDLYIARVNKMAELQKRFDSNPSPANLGDSSAVSPESYSLALLLSIVFTNHRFEIMEALGQRLRELPRGSAGRIASIGCGTGYELRLAAQALPTWHIEGYDTDPEMQARAELLLRFFGVRMPVKFAAAFPLAGPTPEVRRQYDAIILCEVLEHLVDPALALTTLRECLTENGRMFVTMAINIAQEDHVFLYPDVESCRRQLRESGLETLYEWIAPQTIRFPPANREAGFKKGNYIAIAGRPHGASNAARVSGE